MITTPICGKTMRLLRLGRRCQGRARNRLRNLQQSLKRPRRQVSPRPRQLNTTTCHARVNRTTVSLHQRGPSFLQNPLTYEGTHWELRITSSLHWRFNINSRNKSIETKTNNIHIHVRNLETILWLRLGVIHFLISAQQTTPSEYMVAKRIIFHLLKGPVNLNVMCRIWEFSPRNLVLRYCEWPKKSSQASVRGN